MADTRMDACLQQINAALERLLPECDYDEPVVCDAMRYSVQGGGKRIRPLLVLESCRLCGGMPETAIEAACALEMIHSYSLVHDDLPCMDNDDLRRGKPSCHKQFGESYALLAGDGLLTEAFYVISTAPFAKAAPEKALRVIAVLSEAAGANGMIGGQVIDLASEGKQIPLARLQQMDAKKTGALIRAACQMGAVIAGADDTQTAALCAYADCIGQAFQIVDDILDVTGDAAVFGKPIGSDAANEKSTYVSLLGLDGAKAQAKALTEDAIAHLAVFGNDAQFLQTLAGDLLKRTY